MQKKITLCLLGATLLLGGCARQYPVFNQMPTQGYLTQVERATKVDQAAPVQESTLAPEQESTPATRMTMQESEAPAVAVQPEAVQPEAQPTKAPEVLWKSTPKQLNEDLSRALATTQGQKLMTNATIADQIQKVQTMLEKADAKAAQPTQAQINKAKKMADKSIKQHMGPEAAKALNRDLRIGLILIAVAILLSLIPGFYWVASIVGVIGVVFIILGLVNM
ncbi:preprotein translocase subunit SecF [Rhabdobacter roseus]|uniref:Preprotein translocase subunit SecF n=1 Tax=Rhabdobacter roseus TaxID=1655419 RepID=A0A840TN46_9BACT|nr:DUF308 domain-containing protein [Rhabdobacter roseus]MBB5284355.1 preprotein translocase subunit SecF [Rhabdobacter roseus]